MKRNMFWTGRRALDDVPNKMLGESLWRLWARRTDARLNREQLWDMVEPYERPKSMTPLILLNIAAFYTGVVAAAVTEQLHKVSTLLSHIHGKSLLLGLQFDLRGWVCFIFAQERYWAEHPGQAIPIMKPMLYIGPYKVRREDFGEDAPGQ